MIVDYCKIEVIFTIVLFLKDVHAALCRISLFPWLLVQDQ